MKTEEKIKQEIKDWLIRGFLTVIKYTVALLVFIGVTMLFFVFPDAMNKVAHVFGMIVLIMLLGWSGITLFEVNGWL